MKIKENYSMIDETKQIWCYPKFQLANKKLSRKQERVSTEDEDSDFNDLETDERINLDIVKLDNSFPDPIHYCIGFLTESPR